MFKNQLDTNIYSYLSINMLTLVLKFPFFSYFPPDFHSKTYEKFFICLRFISSSLSLSTWQSTFKTVGFSITIFILSYIFHCLLFRLTSLYFSLFSIYHTPFPKSQEVYRLYGPIKKTINYNFFGYSLTSP